MKILSIPLKNTNKFYLASIIAILLMIFLAYFVKLRSFGLYEDDYWFIGIPANSSFSEIIDFLKSNLTNLQYNQGRFIGMTLSFLLPWFTYKIGGLYFTYIVGFVIVVVNATLFYKILKYRFSNLVALGGALIFALFPADTTKSLLIHQYQLQLSVMFSLIAMNLFLRDKKIIAYLLALCSLLTYENAFLPFIFIPLLENKPWNKKKFIQLIIHFGIAAILIAIIFILRKFAGEERVAELTMADTIKKTMSSFIIGPATIILSYIIAPLKSLVNYKAALPVAGISLTILVIIFLSTKQYLLKSDNSDKSYAINTHLISLKLNIKKELEDSIVLMVVGTLMLIVAYGFSVTHYPPTNLAGRGTSVHLGAGVGGTILFIGFINLVWTLSRKMTGKYIILGLLGIYISLLTGYGMIIQNDYKKSWNIQTGFISDIAHNVNKVHENNIILIKNEPPVETKYIKTFSWAVPEMLNRIYKFPDEWKNYPKIVILGNDCDSIYKKNTNEICFKPGLPFLFDNQEEVTVNTNDIILFEMNQEGRLKRLKGTQQINNFSVSVPENDDTGIAFNQLGKENLSKYFRLK